MTFLRTILLVAFIILEPAPRACASEPPKLPDSALVEEFDIYNDGDWLLVPVTIRGKTYSFVLDTGCSSTFLDISLTPGIPVDEMPMLGADGKIAKKMKLYKAPPMQVGKISWQAPAPIVGQDLSQIREVSGHEIYGMIGMDFLRNYAVRIDFDLGKLRLMRSPVRPEGASMPMYFLDSEKRLSWVVGNIPGWGPELFDIDTGEIGYGSVRPDLFRALARKGLIQDLRESKHCTLLGVREEYSGAIDKFTLQDAKGVSLGFGESDFPRSSLGLLFWRRYNLVLDFPGETVYLRKSRCFKNKDHDMSGISFIREKGLAVVDRISEGSPAAEAGLQAGDILLKIAGKDAARTRIVELWKALGKEGEKVVIDYQRGDVKKEIVLLLKSWKQKELRPAFLKEAETKELRASLLQARGNAFAVTKKLDRAIADYDAAIAADPTCMDAWTGRCRTWSKKGDTAKALADANEAIRLKPADPDTYFLRAEVYLAREDLKKARADYRKIIRLDPKNSGEAYREISRSYVNENAWKKAMKAIDEAIRLAPKDADALVCRAGILVNLEKKHEARAELDKAVAIDPYCVTALTLRGMILTMLGEDESALADLNKAISLGMRRPDVYQDRISIWQKRNDVGKAMADLEELLRLDPENSLALGALAGYLANPKTLDDARRAVTLAKKAAALSKYQNAKILEVLACAHAACDDYREAVHWQKAAITLLPQQGEEVQTARKSLAYYESRLP